MKSEECAGEVWDGLCGERLGGTGEIAIPRVFAAFVAQKQMESIICKAVVFVR